MNPLERNSLPASIFLVLFGLVLLIHGIKTIKNKSVFWVSKWTASPSWKMGKIIGKNAVLYGLSDVVTGLVFIAVAIALYLFAG